MKTLTLLSICCLGFFVSEAQQPALRKADVISSKKVYMHYKGNSNESTLIIPVVSDKYPKLKAALSEKVIFDGDSLKSVIKAYQEDGHGITDMSFKVTYLDQRIISIILRYETMGAYPDSYEKWLTLNIRTGKPYALSNEIDPMGLKHLFYNYKAMMTRQLKNAKKDIAQDKELSPDDVNDIFETLKRSADQLKPGDLFSKYVFTGTGITITSEDALPHATRNFEPGHAMDIKYTGLKPYKKPTAIVVK